MGRVHGMKIKREQMDSDGSNRQPLSGTSVHNRLGRSWTRAENRLDKNSRWNKRESPRKRVRQDDLRTKIKKTLDNEKDRGNDGDSDPLVKFKVPRFEMETDEEVLNRREKQISYGKNTVSYDKYISLIPKSSRKDKMPRTPNKMRKYSRRQWDGMVKKWKQDIHATVAALEGRVKEEEEDEGLERDRLSSIGSWADDVDEDERVRSRASSTCSDQGLGNSVISFTDSEDMKEEVDVKEEMDIKDEVF